jgi:anti-sigma B factor antagonist
MTERSALATGGKNVLDIVGPAAGGSSDALVLSGRLDAVEAPLLREHIDRAIESGCRNLVVDLGRVEFVDSAGLAVLVRARRELRAQGGDVVLVRPASDDAMRVFRLTQFDQVFLMVAARAT